MKTKIDSSLFVYSLLAALSLVGQYIFKDFIKFSDGLNYFNAYESMSEEGILIAFKNYNIYTGSSEPISFLILFLFSQLIEFIYANTILNFILLVAIYRYLKDKSINIFIWLPFVITNYYLLLMGYGVIRLKIALIFYFIFLNNKNYFFTLLTIFSHFQMGLIYLFKIPLFISKFYFNYKLIFYLIAIIIILSFSNIDHKLHFYLESTQNRNFPLKCIFIGIFSVFVINNFRKALFIFIIVMTAVFFFGEGRITLLYFLLILSIFIDNIKNGIISKFILIFSLLYLSFKGIDFGIAWSNQQNYFH